MVGIITPEGFLPKTQQELLAEIEAEQLAEISPLLDVSADQPLGQLNGIFTRHMAMIGELLKVAYDGFDRDAAEDAQLTSLAKLTGTVRRGASYSFVVAQTNLDSGTTLEAGTHFAHVLGQPDNRFTPSENFTATSTGTFPVLFRSEVTGAFQANAGTLTVIATPVVGWNSVNNDFKVTEGIPADDDATLRARMDEKLAQAGSSTLRAIIADVLQVDLVETADGFENTTDGVVDGLPPHSFEILVFDGSPPVGDDDDIAQAIWDTKPAGIRPVGSSQGTATDANGDSHPVAFSRVAIAEVYFAYELVVTSGYVGDNAVAEYIAEQCAAKFSKKPGLDVLALFCRALPLDLEGVVDVSYFRLGLSVAPTGESNIVLDGRTLADFDVTRIDVDSLPLP